jgi:hypothetical protein
MSPTHVLAGNLRRRSGLTFGLVKRENNGISRSRRPRWKVNVPRFIFFPAVDVQLQYRHKQQHMKTTSMTNVQTRRWMGTDRNSSICRTRSVLTAQESGNIHFHRTLEDKSTQTCRKNWCTSLDTPPSDCNLSSGLVITADHYNEKLGS